MVCFSGIWGSPVVGYCVIYCRMLFHFSLPFKCTQLLDHTFGRGYDPQNKGSFPLFILHMNRKFPPWQLPIAPQTPLPSWYLLPWLKMPLEVVAFDFLNALNMRFLKKLRVSIVDSGEDTCWEMWEYKQIIVIQSVPSFHCSRTGFSHQNTEDHSMAIPEPTGSGSPLGWVFLVSVFGLTPQSVLFCSLRGCNLWITAFQLICPLVFIRSGQWKALAGDQRVRGGSTSGSEFFSLQPPSSLLPGTDAQWLQSLTYGHWSCLVGHLSRELQITFWEPHLNLLQIMKGMSLLPAGTSPCHHPFVVDLT